MIDEQLFVQYIRHITRTLISKSKHHSKIEYHQYINSGKVVYVTYQIWLGTRCPCRERLAEYIHAELWMRKRNNNNIINYSSESTHNQTESNFTQTKNNAKSPISHSSITKRTLFP